jgi:hypothetical protein
MSLFAEELGWFLDFGQGFQAELPVHAGDFIMVDVFDLLGLASFDFVPTPPVIKPPVIPEILLSRIAPLTDPVDLGMYQYASRPKFQAFIAALTAEFPEIRLVFGDLLTKRSFDTAEGVQLDIIGKIVVLDRPYLDQGIDDAFEFGSVNEIPVDGPSGDAQRAYDAKHGWSGVDRADIGGRLLSVNPQFAVIADDILYKRFLKAKVARNTADGSIPSLINYLSFVFDAIPTVIPGPTIVHIAIDRAISVRERALITEGLPLAGGVQIGDIYYAVGPKPFGFAGNPNNSGYGDANQPQVGSGFVSVLI